MAAAGEDDRNESWERMKYQRGTVVSPTADLETDDMRQKLADLLVTKPTLLQLVQFVLLFWPLAFYFRDSLLFICQFHRLLHRDIASFKTAQSHIEICSIFIHHITTSYSCSKCSICAATVETDFQKAISQADTLLISRKSLFCDHFDFDSKLNLLTSNSGLLHYDPLLPKNNCKIKSAFSDNLGVSA